MSPYAPALYHDRELGEDMPDQWTIQDYTLAQALCVPSNYTAEKLVEASLPRDVAERVTFDSESGCFFAHAVARSDIDVVASTIADLVEGGPNPASEPGTMLDSVACPTGTPSQSALASWVEPLPELDYVTVTGVGESQRAGCPGCGSGDLQMVEPASAPLEPLVRVTVRCGTCANLAQGVQCGGDWLRLRP